MSLAQR